MIHLELPDKKKAYFFSDVHLGSPYHANPIDTERKLVQWLKSIEKDAAYVFMLGDIFDFWFEYKDVVPKGFTRFLGQVAYMCDRGIKVHFFTGNHDIWSFGYLEKELGVILHKGPVTCRINNHVFFMAHGDEYDYRQKGFRIIRHIFHNPLCQKLFASVHPRWTIGLAHAWSQRSRKKGLKKQGEVPVDDFVDESKDYLIAWTKQYLAEHPNSDIDVFVFGHTHKFIDLALANEKRLLVLGDWLRYYSYAEFDGENLSMNMLDSNTTII